MWTKLVTLLRTTTLPRIVIEQVSKIPKAKSGKTPLIVAAKQH